MMSININNIGSRFMLRSTPDPAARLGAITTQLTQMRDSGDISDEVFEALLTQAVATYVESQVDTRVEEIITRSVTQALSAGFAL